MKIWKLVSGILSIALSFFVLFQSCAAGTLNALEDNGEISGSAGFIVAILMIVVGIVSIVARNSNGKGIHIAIVIIYGFAGIMGITSAGSFSDLYIWSAWCLICAVLGIVAIKLGNKNSNSTGSDSTIQ
jgi:hypothetical protein